jgi:glyoxylase-like metal-dependent hydrolase (beta-lactamase superfamily II)
VDSSDRYAWASSRVEEVASGVFRIPLPMLQDGLRAVNVYAIVGDGAITLIDSGWAVPSSRDALVDGLGQLHKGLRDVRQFLVTHLHPDHYAQASVLRDEIGTPISLGEEERPSLEALLRDIAGPKLLPSRIAILTRAGAAALVEQLPPARFLGPELARQWQPPDVWLKGGAAVTAEDRTLTVVPTPGHTRGHVVFHEERARLLFSGDHILPQITPSIGLEAAASPWPLRDYIDSLKLMKTRPDAMLLPAHGPVWESSHARVDQLLQHHERRLDESLKAIEGGASTGLEVAQVLKWTYHDRSLRELDVRNQAMAVGETMAHLDVLVLNRALVSKTDDEGVDRFSTGSG